MHKQRLMRISLAILTSTAVFYCVWTCAEQSSVKGLAQRPASDINSALDRILREWDNISNQEKTDICSEISSILEDLPTVTEQDSSLLTDEEQKANNIRMNCLGVLVGLSRDGHGRASELIETMRQGADYWGRVNVEIMDKILAEEKASESRNVETKRPSTTMPFPEFHCELERVVADTSLSRDHRHLFISDVRDNFDRLYNDNESRHANREALLLLIRRCVMDEEDRFVQHKMLEIHIRFVPEDETESLLARIIASEDTGYNVRALAQKYLRLLEQMNDK